MLFQTRGGEKRVEIQKGFFPASLRVPCWCPGKRERIAVGRTWLEQLAFCEISNQLSICKAALRRKEEEEEVVVKKKTLSMEPFVGWRMQLERRKGKERFRKAEQNNRIVYYFVFSLVRNNRHKHN